MEGYRISGKRSRMRMHDIMGLLAETYWASHWERGFVRRAMRKSQPFGVFAPDGRQVGYARVVTDFTTMFYLADVVVAKELRGKGIGQALLRYVLADERFAGAKGLLLTGDAHGFYEHFGFVRVPERCMELRNHHQD